MEAVEPPGQALAEGLDQGQRDQLAVDLRAVVGLSMLGRGIDPVAGRTGAGHPAAGVHVRREHAIGAVAEGGGQQGRVGGLLQLVADDPARRAEAVHEATQALERLHRFHRLDRELAAPLHQHRHAVDVVAAHAQAADLQAPPVGGAAGIGGGHGRVVDEDLAEGDRLAPGDVLLIDHGHRERGVDQRPGAEGALAGHRVQAQALPLAVHGHRIQLGHRVARVAASGLVARLLRCREGGGGHGDEDHGDRRAQARLRRRRCERTGNQGARQTGRGHECGSTGTGEKQADTGAGVPVARASRRVCSPLPAAGIQVDIALRPNRRAMAGPGARPVQGTETARILNANHSHCTRAGRRNENTRPEPGVVRSREREYERYFALPWLATASAARLAASGSPR